MSLIRKTDADSLANELLTAREQYNQKRNAVLDRSTARRNVVAETITDLKAEDDALAQVVASAQQG